MYVIVGLSRLNPGATPDVPKNILARLSESPDFVTGTIGWSADGERGRSMFVFKTREAAEAALEQALANMPDDAPMEIESAEVCDVVAHA